MWWYRIHAQPVLEALRRPGCLSDPAVSRSRKLKTENYFLARLAWQAWCPWLAGCRVRQGHGSGGGTGWRRGRVAFLRRCDARSAWDQQAAPPPQVMETWSVVECINSFCLLCCASTAVSMALCWTRSQSLFPSPAVLSSRLIRAAPGLATWLREHLYQHSPADNMWERSGGGGKWKEKVEAVLLLGLGIQPCTRLLGRNISLRCVTVAHCCCFLLLLCAELFLVQGS